MKPETISSVKLRVVEKNVTEIKLHRFIPLGLALSFSIGIFISVFIYDFLKWKTKFELRLNDPDWLAALVFDTTNLSGRSYNPHGILNIHLISEREPK